MIINLKNNGDLTVTIYIEEVAGATSYNIYYSTNPAEDGYTLLDSTSNTEYVTSALNEGYTYYFRVSAVVSGVEQQPSAAKSIYISRYEENGIFKVAALVKNQLVSLYDTKKIYIDKDKPQFLIKDYIIWIQPADGETEEISANYIREVSYPINLFIFRIKTGLDQSVAMQEISNMAEDIKDLFRNSTLEGYINSAEITDVVGPVSLQENGASPITGLKISMLFKRRINFYTDDDTSLYNEAYYA